MIPPPHNASALFCVLFFVLARNGGSCHVPGLWRMERAGAVSVSSSHLLLSFSSGGDCAGTGALAGVADSIQHVWALSLL